MNLNKTQIIKNKGKEAFWIFTSSRVDTRMI